MAASGLDFEKQFEELERLIAELKKPEKRAEAAAQGIDLEAQVAQLEAELQRMLKKQYSLLTPWEKTLVARHKDRPYALDYIRMVFDDFLELYGDRLSGNDEAVVGGLAVLTGEPVVVIGQQKGRDLKERQRRNFGSAHPEGFRKALRLARLAQKFRKPLISLVDTPAAAADLAAEERGISEAIARNLKEFAVLKVPIVVVIIGEGGSGGALGMAIGDRVLMLEHSVYSVIPPEGCAAILWRDREKAPEAAKALNLTAQGALALGIIDEVLPEPVGGAHRDPAGAAATLKEALVRHLAALRHVPPDTLVASRLQRLRSIGFWTEA